ncbi:MAG: alpha/beta hydrolase fold domain-containing protein, partial [Eubacteriales bacterium]|nr:alpha/beta hydrolase fold domain-containing protein [Eubacteriales bacterium]
MSKSISAKLTSEVLELFSMYMEDNADKLIEDARRKGEQPSSPPLVPKTRSEDHQNGRVFYANEDSGSGITVFYLHGGAYFMDFALAHWKLINKLIKETDAQVIAAGYRRLPFATWREAFDLIVPLYKEYCETHPDQKIILMGDSAGGGLAAALAEQFKEDGIRMPD